MVFLAIILAVCLLLILMMGGRRGQPGLQRLQGWNYTHRGLHGSGVPENSLAAFQAAVDNGYGAELDIHLLKDGGLAVIHDSSLLRTTGCEGKVEDLTTADLSKYHLNQTQQTIPEFRQVLKIFEGKAPLIVELKAQGNVEALCQTAAKVLDEYKGVYCIESFHPQVVAWFRKNRPNVIRGQLTENYFRTPQCKLPWILKFSLTHQLLNFWTRPDFVAYNYRDRKTFSNWVVRSLWGVQGVSWTLRTKEEFDRAVEEKWLPIFEGFRP